MLIVVGLLVLVLAIVAVGVVATRRAGRRPSVTGAPSPSLPAVEAPVKPEVAVEVPPGRRFSERLAKARTAFTGALASVFARERLDDEAWEELEEALIGADVGVATTSVIVEDLRLRAKEDKIESPDRLLDLLKDELKAVLETRSRALDLACREGVPAVVLVTGVNGTGKTTTIGKLAAQMGRDGKKVVVAAADTFRAAAAEQLRLWAERSGAELVRGQEGGDPASVVFDAVELARARNYDACIVDTAGRLHTKSNLMEELKKIGRIIERSPGRLSETLLVLDATTGQNGIAQAREFAAAVGVSGVVLTKLDGSARGGVVLAIEQELQIPVKLVGLGEGIDDLAPFDPDAFVEALFA